VNRGNDAHVRSWAGLHLSAKLGELVGEDDLLVASGASLGLEGLEAILPVGPVFPHRVGLWTRSESQGLSKRRRRAKKRTHQLGLLLYLDLQRILLRNQSIPLSFQCLDLVLEHLQLLGVDPLVLGQNRLVTVLPPLVVLLQQLDVVLLGLDLGLQRLNLLLEGVEFGERLTKPAFHLSELALRRLVLVAKGLVALAEKLGGVDALEKLGVLGGGSGRVAALLTLL
jgi:hypothetical protein